jgi:hypothetical protein
MKKKLEKNKLNVAGREGLDLYIHFIPARLCDGVRGGKEKPEQLD